MSPRERQERSNAEREGGLQSQSEETIYQFMMPRAPLPLDPVESMTATASLAIAAAGSLKDRGHDEFCRVTCVVVVGAVAVDPFS